MREITRLSGFSSRTVQQELTKLSRLTLLTKRKDGNRVYYQANEDHPLFSEIRNIVLKTNGLTDRLKQSLENYSDIKFAFIFGSIAQSNEKANSDLDLMIIGNITLRKLTDLLLGVSDQIRREINPHIFTQEEFSKRKQDKDHFLDSVLNAPKLFIIGNENELKADVTVWLKQKHPDLLNPVV
ncbi:MAG: toxin-antitoxin system toxin subunit [Desulfobacteraceae bacterium]|nr:MAG: toxin-antitoxin system toxin subunit [Desulfobacteraceae bacterium]